MAPIDFKLGLVSGQVLRYVLIATNIPIIKHRAFCINFIFYIITSNKDISLKFIPDTFENFLTSQTNNDIERSKFKVTAMVFWHSKGQSYFKNIFFVNLFVIHL